MYRTIYRKAYLSNSIVEILKGIAYSLSRLSIGFNNNRVYFFNR